MLIGATQVEQIQSEMLELPGELIVFGGQSTQAPLAFKYLLAEHSTQA